jgi:hypothetical protein
MPAGTQTQRTPPPDSGTPATSMTAPLDSEKRRERVTSGQCLAGGERRLWIDPAGSVAVPRMAAYGAFLPLVGQSTNDQNCPSRDLHDRVARRAALPESRRSAPVRSGGNTR